MVELQNLHRQGTLLVADGQRAVNQMLRAAVSAFEPVSQSFNDAVFKYGGAKNPAIWNNGIFSSHHPDGSRSGVPPSLDH